MILDLYNRFTKTTIPLISFRMWEKRRTVYWSCFSCSCGWCDWR